MKNFNFKYITLSLFFVLSFFTIVDNIYASELTESQSISLTLQRVLSNKLDKDHIFYDEIVNLNNINKIVFYEDYIDNGYFYVNTCVKSKGCQSVTHKRKVLINEDESGIDYFNFASYTPNLYENIKRKAYSFMNNYGNDEKTEYTHYENGNYDDFCKKVYDNYEKPTQQGDTTYKYFSDAKVDGQKVSFGKYINGNTVYSQIYFKMKICRSNYYANYAADLDEQEKLKDFQVNVTGIGEDFLTNIGGIDEFIKKNDSYSDDVKGKYVCVMGMHINHSFENNDATNISSFIPEGKNSLHATILNDDITNNKNETDILDLCKTYFNADNVGLYKISDVNVKTNKTTVKNTSSSFTCKWNYKPDDYDSSVVMSFRFNVSMKNKRIYFDDINNIASLYPYLSFTHEEMAKLLNRDKTILDELEKSIDRDVPNGYKVQEEGNTAKSLSVLSIVGGVSLIAIGTAISIASGGTLTGVGAAIISAGVKIGIGLTIVGIGGLVLSNFIKETSNTVYQMFGIYNEGTASFIYHNFEEIKLKNPYQNIRCTYEDSVTDEEIKPNIKVECDTILDSNFGRILSYIMNILRFIGCALLILFGVMDFIKPIVSGDAEMLQKSGSKFVKRIIIFILILFVPALVKLLLSLIDKQSCNL